MLYFINFPSIWCDRVQTAVLLWAGGTPFSYWVWFLCCTTHTRSRFCFCCCMPSVSNNSYQIGSLCSYLPLLPLLLVEKLLSATGGRVVLVHSPSSRCTLFPCLSRQAHYRPDVVDGCNSGANQHFTEREEMNCWAGSNIDLPLGISSPFPLPSSLSTHTVNRVN